MFGLDSGKSSQTAVTEEAERVHMLDDGSLAQRPVNWWDVFTFLCLC